MKNKATPPPFYKWEQAKLAADKLAIWAYAKIVNPKSPHAKAYPLNGISTPLLLDGTWDWNCIRKKNRAGQTVFRQSGNLSARRTCQRRFRAGRSERGKFIAQLKATGPNHPYYQNHPFYGWMVNDLGRLIGNATRLLVDLVDTKI